MARINSDLDFCYVLCNKLGCVVRTVVDSILPHAECGPNNHRKDAPPFKHFYKQIIRRGPARSRKLCPKNAHVDTLVSGYRIDYPG